MRIEQRPLATDEERQEIELLTARCDLHDGTEHEIVVPPAGELPHGDLSPILALEEETIAGYLALEGWPIPEGTPIVHPGFRRRGIGRAMVEAATAAVRNRGGRRWLMVVDLESAGAASFAEKVGARYDSSELRMDLVVEDLPLQSPSPQGGQLEPVPPAEAEEFARTLAAAFDDPLDQVRRWASEQSEIPNVRLYVARNAGQAVGVVRLVTIGFHAYVTAVGVLPEYRRQGLGRWIVLSSVHGLLAEGWTNIRIEVDTANEAAYRLYRECGFQETRTYRSFEMMAS